MGPNPNVSNGTCYEYDGVEADKAFIPCGNAALGVQSCCQVGDMCLESSACFNIHYYVTYLAGCTDPNYDSLICPRKAPWETDHWVGLIYLGKDSNEWSPCHQKAGPTTIAPADPCPASTQKDPQVAFTAGSVIENVGLLPITVGGSIKWQGTHTPSFSPPASTSSSLGSSATKSTTSSDATVTSSTDSTSSTSLIPSGTPAASASAQSTRSHDGILAGIIIGSVVGGLLLLGALSAVFMLYRRNRKNSDHPDSYAGPFSSSYEPKPLPAEMPSPTQPMTPGFSELGSDTTARPWSLGSELPANQGGIPPSVSSGVVSPQHSPEQSPYVGGYGHGPGGLHPSMTHSGMVPAHHLAPVEEYENNGVPPSMTHSGVIPPHHSPPVGSTETHDQANKPALQAFSPLRHYTISELP